MILIAEPAPVVTVRQSPPGRWERVALRTPAQAATNFAGGEGGQWPRGIVYSADGTRALLCIDVAGIYLSEDSGVSWNVRSNGYTARGCASAAFDPRNPDRIVAIGANSAANPANGIYLSEDGARSWRQVLSAGISGLNEVRTQVAWDETTYDDATRKTKTVYWSRVEGDSAHWGTVDDRPGLWRSDDGGATWSELPSSREAGGGAFLRARNGRLYSGNRRGVWLSTTRGASWTKLLDGEVTGLAFRGDRLVASLPQRIVISRSGDDTRWDDLPVTGIRNGTDVFRHVEVSPADPNRIAVWRESVPNTWNWPRFVSRDGGATWSSVTISTPEAFLPVNARQGMWAWHPTNPDVALSIGGDLVTRSTDGGRNLGWSNAGNNAILVGGMFNFNVKNPDLLFVGSQDYNGASTSDGGRSWTYRNPSGNGWGGFTYSGYALSDRVFAIGDAPGWGGGKRLKVSRDGGSTWNDTGVDLAGTFETALGSAVDPRVAFVKEARTADGGRTWTRMTACDGVYASVGSALFGVKRVGEGNHRVVRSTDLGRSWRQMGSILRDVRDLAFDRTAGRLYAVDGGDLKLLVKNAWTNLPTLADSFGNRNARSVAVDPRRPSILYVGSAANVYATSVPVQRSLDGGRTWRSITEPTPLPPGRLDGGRESICVRVHPRTGHLWAATSCYGIWRWIPE